MDVIAGVQIDVYSMFFLLHAMWLFPLHAIWFSLLHAMWVPLQYAFFFSFSAACNLVYARSLLHAIWFFSAYN